MQAYVYRTPICDWVIRPHENRWQLRWYFDDGFAISGYYPRPEQAADDVAHGTTGFHEWDDAIHPQEIADIAGWYQVANYLGRE